MSGAVVSAVASQQEGPGFDSGSGCFGVDFACSPCVSVGSLRVFGFHLEVQKHAKLVVG